jgi:murein DD-endopeptidase MepM/ murein hydrolase activator NlpD
MRQRVILIVLLSLSGCMSTVRRDSHCAWRVCVSFTDTPAGRSYTASNSEPVPVTIALEFRTVENLRPPAERRVELVVAPRSSADVAYLPTIARDRPVGASITIEIDLGSSTNEVDEDFVYAVPFGGEEPRELVQGFDGPETHLGSMRYSLDFAMPKGTPVLAARGGQVLLVQDGFTEGGTDPKLLERANLVVVAHSDGSMASYGHLERGVRVRVGQQVREGQLLGYSGATGFAGQPHLHFHVGNRMLGEPGRTLNIRMRDEDGREVPLDVGALVEPARRRYPQG